MLLQLGIMAAAYIFFKVIAAWADLRNDTVGSRVDAKWLLGVTGCLVLFVVGWALYNMFLLAARAAEAADALSQGVLPR